MSSAWSWTFAWEILPELLASIGLTLVVMFLGYGLAIVLGLPLAAARLSRSAIPRRVATMVVNLFRGTPFLVQLYFIYFALPELGVTLSSFWTGVLTLGLYYCAFTSDTFLTSVVAIPRAIIEGCAALNVSNGFLWRRVLLPLGMRASIPALMNYQILAFKETAILVAIGLPILLGKAQAIGYSSFRYLEPYTLVGIIYIAIAVPAIILARKTEKKDVFE